MLTLEQQNYAYNAYLETMRYLNKPKSLLHPEFSSNSAMYVFTTENLTKMSNTELASVTGWKAWPNDGVGHKAESPKRLRLGLAISG